MEKTLNVVGEKHSAKLKIASYFLTVVCGLGYICSSLYALYLANWALNFQFVIVLYGLASGLFILLVLFPVPPWRRAMQNCFPFLFSFLGRSAFFLLFGPLHIVTSEFVGYGVAAFSVCLGIFYFILFFVFRNYIYKISFFWPFEKDVPDGQSWEYGGQEKPRLENGVDGVDPKNTTKSGRTPFDEDPKDTKQQSLSSSSSSEEAAPRPDYNPFDSPDKKQAIIPGGILGKLAKVNPMSKSRPEENVKERSSSYNPFGSIDTSKSTSRPSIGSQSKPSTSQKHNSIPSIAGSTESLPGNTKKKKNRKSNPLSLSIGGGGGSTSSSSSDDFLSKPGDTKFRNNPFV